MIKLSLTDFVDISSKVGTSKITNIGKVKNRPPYSPATDYYKRLRDHFINLHKNNYDKNSILPTSVITQNINKQQNYNEIIDGYKKFWGKKDLRWFDPPHLIWESHDIGVILNPELGLEINNIPHVIKLYFKKEKLTKARVDISLFLMHQFMSKQFNNKNINYCILDIRRSKLIEPTSFHKNILSALYGESSYISTVWPTIV